MTTTTIRLGYAMPMGAPVDVPLKHLAICGQTQEAGKTTALEGLITRSGLKALTFVTKRGEGSFTTSTRHAPYFREQADWQFVASILEASRGERLKFERAWIIRASRGAQTLREVQINIKRGMKTAKGLSLDVFTVLDAYLEVVVPQIDRLQWADMIVLRPGVNVMDLSDIPSEMQHLVIKSSLDWVLNTATETVVVIPEAWKFIPQGRGTPVKLAAEALIRQGAALKNYVWLDSQDLGGIDKTILRSVAVWLLGVQREANEIKRTLTNIPEGVSKPSAADLATLDLGEFYACWGRHSIKTYAQPTWLDDDTAHDIAVGLANRSTAAAIQDALASRKENDVDPDHDRILKENAHLRAENAELRRRIETLELGGPVTHAIGRDAHMAAKEHATKLAKPNGPMADIKIEAVPAFPDGDLPTDHGTERLYQLFKARLIEEAATDAAVLRVLENVPEIIVERSSTAVTVDGQSTKGRVATLIASGFFAEPRGVGLVRKELTRTGKDPGGGGALGILLGNLVKDRLLLRDGSDFVIAPGVKVTEREVRA